MVTLNKTKSMCELCEITSSKRIYVADYQIDGIPFYRGKEIIEKQRGNLAVSTKIFISEDKFNEIRTKFGATEPGDVLLSSVGTLGVPYVVKNNDRFYFKDGNLTWFRKFNGLDNHYLYYWLLSPKGKAELKKCTIGASQPAFTIVLLKDMKIELPPILTQRKIVKILSAYDDLIENNTRRTKIIEEIAQRIYQEWFVKFRFPGHEKVKMVDSELGKILEGWEVKKLGEISKIVMGQSPKSKFYNTKGRGLPFHQGVKDFGYRFPTNIKYCIKEQRVAKKEDILLSVRAPVGRINIANTKIIIGRGLSALSHKKSLQSFLFYQLQNIFSEEDIMGSGAIFNAITKGDLFNVNFIVPGKDIDRRFNEIVRFIDKQIEKLQSQIDNLRKTRDLLLPELISGEIDVENIDISTGALNDI